MKIGPDGSFPRITSSSKGITQNIKIVKVPDDQVKESEPLYKVTWIGVVESEQELSEKSDEEVWSEEDVSNTQLPIEKGKDADSEAKDKVKANKPQNEKSVRRYINGKNNRYRTIHKQNNYKSAKRENKYIYNSNRSFSAPGNFGRNYNIPITNTSDNNDIDPWIRPPISANFQYPVFPYGPVIEHLGQTPPNANAKNSVGLLGISPYSPHLPNFPSNSQNDSFMHNPNYWNNNDYHEYHSSDYQRTGPPHATMPVQSNCESSYQRKNHWRPNRKKRTFWNRKRRNNNGHFNHRN